MNDQERIGWVNNQIDELLKELSVGKESEIISNEFSPDIEVELDPVAVAVYDYLMGIVAATGNPENMQVMLELYRLSGKPKTEKEIYNQIAVASMWFMINRPEAYYKLISGLFSRLGQGQE